MTTKAIELTNEQKSLIWSTKLVSAKATEQEAQAFIAVCEEYGLNPLLGDITFQKFETKYGPRVSYLISRDARLKHAMRQDDYVNMLSGVVKEGDTFEVDAINGIPIHKFGSKRGKIVGAWCVVKTKTRGNTIVFPDFAEYQAALSPKNSLWNTMPSAMIEKVAHSQALSRTFPLGVIFASEDEMPLESITESNEPAAQQTVEDQKTKPTPLTDELEAARNNNKRGSQKEKTPKEKTAIPEETVKETKPTTPVKEKEAQPAVQEQQQPEEEKVEPTKPVEEPKQEPIAEEPKQEKPVQKPTKQEEPAPKASEAPESDQALEFIDGKVKISGGSGQKFLHIVYKENEAQKEAFVRGDDKISVFDEFEPGQRFVATIEELNGFHFVLSAQAV